MMKTVLLGLSALAGAFSLEIKVANTGGNVTSGLQYGIMFEVSLTSSYNTKL
jgi:alpha-N-arabinofuranosidase